MDLSVRYRHGIYTYLKVCTLILVSILYVQGLNNLALFKPTSMSSTPNNDYGSEHAVDGVITEPSLTQFCSHGGDTGPSWWQVDLQETAWISHVIIYRATTLFSQPADFQLLVLPDPKCSSTPQICLDYTGILPMGNSTLFCTTPLRGRIVRFSQIGIFFLCEVQVFEFVPTNQETIRPMLFSKRAGEKREITSPLEQEVKSLVDCGRSGLQEGWTYFNYKQQGGLCQLPSESNHSDVITSDTDWDYYEEDPCNI